VPVFYLPLWFQAIDGVTALSSGTDLLATLLLIVVGSILGGFLTSRIGYYTPILIIGTGITAVGTGLFTTLGTNTTTGQWVGYQILYGFGLGNISQGPSMAAQTVLARNDVAIGASLMFFSQSLFGAIFTTVGQNVVDNQLLKRLVALGVPGITAEMIQENGATALISLLPETYRAAALQAYNESLRTCFQVALIIICLGMIGACAMEWRSVKERAPATEGSSTDGDVEGKTEGN
jgi:MFS family permease